MKNRAEYPRLRSRTIPCHPYFGQSTAFRNFSYCCQRFTLLA
jgi:hypothetical protein